MISWLKNLLKDSFVYGIGFGISRFLQVIVLPIITEALPPNEYGYYSNYVIFYTIAGGLFVLGMDSSVARFFFDSEDKKYHSKLFSIGFFCVLLTSLACVTVASFFPSDLLRIIDVPPAYNAALPYVLFTIPVLVLNNFFLTWFKWRRQKFYFLINAIGTVLLFLIPLLLARQVTFLYIFQCIFFSQLIVALISGLLALDYIRPVFDKPLFIAMLKYGFPWMLVFVLGLSRSYLDRFFLTHYLDDDAYGIYNFSARLSMFLALLSTAFDMSFGPLAFSIWNKKEAPQFFARLQSGYVFLISAAACSIAIIAPLLTLVLGRGNYTGAEMILPFLLFAGIPLSLLNFSNLGMAYIKKSFLSTATLLIGFTAVLVLNFLLTPVYLEYGAVNASLIGHLLILVAGYYFSHKYYKIPFRFGKDALIFLFFLALSIAAVQIHFTKNLYYDMGIKLAGLLIVGLFILIIFFPGEYKKSISLLKRIRYVGLRGDAGV